MSEVDFEDLLLRTSRTFALSIPLLEQPVRRQVTLAYLLFRIADTFEDAASWPKQERRRALLEFRDWLDRRPDPATRRETIARWLEVPPSEHDGYLDLIRHADDVVAAFERLDPAAREAVRRHTQRTCDGMADFVERADDEGSLQLADVDDLRSYCYVVAGIVGEMLTELFLADSSRLEPLRGALGERAATFGEALQLVNILKDAAEDRAEGRRFLPSGVDLDEIFELARRDLDTAKAYVRLLQQGGAPRGDVAFTALPVKLAAEALDAVEARGSGAKVSRERVLAMVQELHGDLDAGRPAV